MRLMRNLTSGRFWACLALFGMATAFPLRGEVTTTTLDFEGGGDSSLYGYAGSMGFTAAIEESAGKAAGRGLKFSNGSGTRAGGFWLKQPFDLAANNSLSTSILIKPNEWTGTNGTNATFLLGFVQNTSIGEPVGSTNFLSSGNNYRSLYAELIHDASSSNRFRLRLYNKSGTGGSSNVSSQINITNASALKDNWLRLTLTLTRPGASQYSAEAVLENLGPDGTATPVVLDSVTNSSNMNNAAMAEATTTYAGFNLSLHSGNSTSATYFDDYRVSVEGVTPGAPAALSAAGPFTTTRFTSRWEPPAGTFTAQGYLLELVKAGDPFEADNFIAANGATGQATGIALGAAATSQAFQNLQRNQAYQYRVRAVNGAGTGPESNTIDISTANVNTPPTFNPIVGPPPQYPGDAVTKTVGLSGISTGDDDDQTLTVTAVSDNQAIVTDGSLSITSVSNGNATLSYTPTGAAGVANITVTVKDFTGVTEEGSISQQFTVRVQQPPLSYGFDDETDLDEYGQGSSTNVAATWGATNGVGDPSGGGIGVTKGDNAHGYYNGWRAQPLDFTGKDLVRTSILVNLANFSPHTSDSGVHLGFAVNSADVNGAPAGTSASTSSFLQANNSTYRAIGAYLGFTSANGGTLSAQIHNKSGTGAAAAAGSAPTLANLDKNQWLRLSLELTPSGGANEFAATTRVESLGPDGTGEPELLLVSRSAVVNGDIFSSQKAYAAYNVYFRNNLAAVGTIRLDEHEASAVTVEPPAPEALEATGITTTNFTANWEPAAFGAAASQGFIVKVVADEDDFETGPYYQLNGSLDDDPVIVGSHAARSAVFTGLDLRGEPRYYRVVSRNPTGESEESNTVVLTLSPDNIPPTLDPIPSPASIHPSESPHSPVNVNLSGIGNGGDVGQELAVTAESSDPSIAIISSVNYLSPSSGGSITYIPTGTAGEAVITVTVDDGEDTFSRSFTVRVQTPPAYFQFDTEEDLGEFGMSTTSNLAYAWDAEAGVGSPAGGGLIVQRTSSSSSATHNGWRLQPFDFAGKSYLQTSILINMKDWNDDGALRLGFLTNTGATDGAPPSGITDNFLSTNSYRAVALQMEYSDSSNGRFRVQIRNKNSTSGSSQVGSNIDATNVDNNGVRNNWIRFTLVLIPTSTEGQYTATAKIEDLGPDGLSDPSLLNSGSGTLTNLPLATAGQKVYAAYGLSLDSDNSGRTWLDDHEAIASSGAPEAPEALPATGISTTNFTANWRRASTGGYPLLGYVVELVKAGDPFVPGNFIAANGDVGQSAGAAVANSAATSLVFTGLERGENYVYRVRARNGDGDSPYSDEIPVGVSAVNIPPTLDPLPAQTSIHPGDTATRAISLSGISHGGDVGQTLTVTAVSSHPEVVTVSPVLYTSPNVTGSFTYTPTGIAGSVTITVTVDDGEDSLVREVVVHVRTPPANYGFDTYGETSAEHYYATNSSSAYIDWLEDRGVGGGGALVIGKTSSTSATLAGMRRQALNLVGQTYAGTSLMIDPREWTGTNQANATVRVGYIHTTGALPYTAANSFSTGNAFRSAYVQFTHNASANTLVMQIYNKSGTGNSSAVAGTSVTLANASTYLGQWLRFGIELIPDTIGSSDYLALLRLEGMGADGIGTPVVLAESEGVLANAALAASSSAYACWDVYKHSGNTGRTYIDNHGAATSVAVPAAPTSLPAGLVVKHAFTARWERPASSAVGGYVLEVSTAEDNFAEDTLIDESGAGGYGEGIDLPASATSLRIWGLNPETEYVYRVKAVNSIGEGPYSLPVAVTTFDEDYNLPPTLDPIISPAVPVAPNSGLYTVNLTGITDGGEGDQDLTFSAVSSNVAAILPPEVIGYNRETGTAQVVFEPDSMEDTVTITVTVDDGQETDNTVTRSFTVVVREQPQSFTFDGTNSDWVNEYSNGISAGTANWTPSAGHNGGGGLALADSGSSSYISLWRKQPYNFVGKSYIYSSIMIRPVGWTEGDGKERIFLGFSMNNAGSFQTTRALSNNTGTYRTIGAYLESRVNTSFRLSLFNKPDTASTPTPSTYETVGNASTLRNNWLRLSVELIPTGEPGVYTAKANLEDMGLLGTNAPVLVGTYETTLTNADIAASSEVYAAYEQVTTDDDTGTVYVDNHEVIVAGGVPNVPTALPASIVVGQAFTANWSAPAASSIDGYVLEVSTDETFAENTFVAATGATGQATGIDLSRTTTSLRLEGLTYGTDYWYRVKAYNNYGDGEYSNAVAVSTYGEGGNAAPTLNPIVFPYSRISPHFGPVTVNLSGITDGGEGGQTLAVSVESDNPAVAYATVSSYTSPAATGQIEVRSGSATGVATISVTVSDGHSVNSAFTQSFLVDVRPNEPMQSFASAGDWTSEYGSAAFRLASNWGGSNGAGTPATGGIHIANLNDDDDRYASAWRSLPYILEGATAIRTSILIKPSGWEEKDDREQFYLGFTHLASGGTPSANDVMRENTAYRAIGVRLASRVDEGNQLRLAISNKAGTGSASISTATTISNGNTLKNNWLRLSVTFTPTGTNQFAAVATLENLGSDGRSAPTQLGTANATITNAALFSSRNAYAAFTSYIDESDGGQIYLDDHFAEVERSDLGSILTLEQPINNGLTSGTSTVSFGSLPVGGSGFRQFVIRNSGSEELTGIAAEVFGTDAASVEVGAPSEISLMPGATATLGVTFHNSAPGPLSATLRVTSAETEEAPFEVALSAVGLSTVQPGLSLSANPNVSLGRKLGVPGADNNRSGGALAVSGSYAVAGSNGGAVAIHNPATGALIRHIALPAGAGPEFGRSVAVFGNLVAIGSPLEDGTGVVYVYNAATGAQVFRALPPASEGGTRFGQSVGLNGDVLVVGDPTATGGGAAYLYDAAWGVFLTYVLPSSPSAGQEFGATLVVDGAQVLVGAPGETGGGAAYLFQIFDSSQIFRIASDDGASGDRFGASLALDAQRIVAGAPGRYSGQGAAFVFSRSGGTLQQELVASDTVAGDGFGSSVALSPYGVLVGAAEKGAGMTYVFNASSGAEVYRIAAADGAAGDGFGSAVAAAGNRVLVGAPSHGGGGVERGGVYNLRFPPYQPDGTVGATSAKQTGRGVHNPSGAGQHLNLVSKKLRKVKGVVTATNDGLAVDSLLVRGTAGNKLFKVAYFTATGGRANVTAAMSKGGTVLANLASGEVRHYSVEIAPQKKKLQKKKKNGKKVILKKKFNGRVTLSSQSAPSQSDVVTYRVQTK